MLRRDVVNHPDQVQYERAQLFGVSTTAIFYALKRLGISSKKNAVSSEGKGSGTDTVSKSDHPV